MSYSDKLTSIKEEIISKYDKIILIPDDVYSVSHHSTSNIIENMAIVVDSFEAMQYENRKEFYHTISEYLGESVMYGIDFGDKVNSELSSKMLILQAEKLPPEKMIGLAEKLNIEFINETEFLNMFRKREFELNL